MFTKKLQVKSDKLDLIDTVKKIIRKADKVIIGAGAGLSASGGLDYGDYDFFEKSYKVFLEMGYKNLFEVITDYHELTEDNAGAYWFFWSRHINTIYYRDQLAVYESLYDIVKEKDYFIITTNVDGQFYKNLFSPDRVFAMQGDYGKLQCSKSCHETIYDNNKWIKSMLDDPGPCIDSKLIPRCPKCHSLLKPYLRIDHNFIEVPDDNRVRYHEFLDEEGLDIVLLELGVGYNTPQIIRYPFDQLADYDKQITLIRINKSNASQFLGMNDNKILFDDDIKEILELLT